MAKIVFVYQQLSLFGNSDFVLYYDNGDVEFVHGELKPEMADKQD